MKALRFALVALARDWKSGELAVLFGALLVAVTALTAVGFFTSRISQAITQQAGGPELLTFVATDPTFFTPPRPRRKPSTRIGDKL